MSKDLRAADDVPVERVDAEALLQILREKDKDLELAAKIGKSLLEQNRELQERNEFLEESLIANNEAITQLQHHLKQRTSLLNAFTEYDNEEEGSVVDGSGERVGFVENLQKRVRQLEDENHKLREEATALRQQATTGEEREYERVNDYLSQLEKANIKISRLQAQLTEQSKECAEHAEEVERLVNEISKRKGHETMLSKENEDLATQLGQYVKTHDELVSEMTELQERYLEVVGMLSETEEELRGHRQRTVPHRSLSSDSLYDSLASELETSDSGCYNTPLVSGRSDSRQSSIGAPRLNSTQYLAEPDASGGAVSLQLELARMRSRESPIAEVDHPSVSVASSESEEPEDPPQDPISSNDMAEYDVLLPARKAFVDAVRRSLSADRQRRSRSKSPREPMRETLQEKRAVSTADEPSEEEACTPATDTSTTTLAQEVHLANPAESVITAPVDIAPVVHQKTFCDASCSPIQSMLHEDSEMTPRAEPPVSRFTSYQRQGSASTSTSPPDSGRTVCKSSSSESLADYDVPKLGVPGCPGTRDLDFSIRRLNLRRRIEAEYQRFRRQRGLGPSKSAFYGLTSIRAGERRPLGPLSSQLHAMTRNRNDATPKTTARPLPMYRTSSYGIEAWGPKPLVGLNAVVAGRRQALDREGVAQPSTLATASAVSERLDHASTNVTKRDQSASPKRIVTNDVLSGSPERSSTGGRLSGGLLDALGFTRVSPASSLGICRSPSGLILRQLVPHTNLLPPRGDNPEELTDTPLPSVLSSALVEHDAPS